ncbi:MAG: glycosyltransferase [Hadesarchaea archaeon]|nr:glycosyltransferase [Hadesarchaea archaeon]
MRFACVELYTKYGKIWDRAKEKPNYLCDPKTEIDTCSFGCWTSALGGEHVPLLWFKLRKPVRYIYHNYLAPRMSRFNYAGYSIVSKLINRALDKFYNLQYVTKFDVVLIVVHDYSIREMAKFIVKAKKLRKKPIFLGALGNTLDSFRETLKDKDAFRFFKIFIDNCDVFVNYYHEAISDYLGLYTDTPIVNFPQFYPFEFAKSFFEPYENKEKIIFVSGDTSRTDHISSLLIAKKIQAQYPDFLIEVIGRPSLNLEPLKNSRYKVTPFFEWIDYLKHTGKTHIIIDMDNTWTLGRVVRDAAVVGTPCIGLNSESQKSLFPNLVCSDITDTKKAIDLGIKLIEDRKFYERVQKKAFKRLEAYSYENSVKRLSGILEEYTKK